MIDNIPDTIPDAAHWWLDFGFNVIPLNPGTKQTAVKWQPWLDALNHDAIDAHWKRQPGHHLGFIVDDRHLVLDADSPESLAALHEIEEAHDIEPGMVVHTNKGEHHYYRRAAGTYAKQCGFNSETEPQKIDVKTGRGGTEGRSMVVLYPTPGKEVELLEVESADGFPEVGQGFIDAVFQHNERQAPRKPEPREVDHTRKAASDHMARELLEYLDPDMGYTDWFNVAAGTHDYFDGSDVGLALFDEWSARGSDYPGAEEVEYKWSTLTPGVGITFRTVERMAEEAGADVKAIRKRYNPDGSRKRTEADMLTDAKEMTEETDSETVEALVRESAGLSAIAKRRVRSAIKDHTGMPFSVMNDADKEGHEEGEGGDHLQLAQSLVDEIGPANVLTVPAFCYRWNDGGVWERKEDRAVRQWVQAYLAGKETVSKSTVDSVADLFKTEVFKPHHEFDVGPVECVNTPTGELVLEDGKWHLKPHMLPPM